MKNLISIQNIIKSFFKNIIHEEMLKLPKGRPANQPIDITYSYDESGKMHCMFTDVESGNSHEIELPNIILVLADDLGYGDLSIYVKDNNIKTPNLDQMAIEGIRFTDAHTPASVCTPTRYGLLTGRYNWRTSLKQGVLTGKSKALIPSKRTTIASLLKRKYYW